MKSTLYIGTLLHLDSAAITSDCGPSHIVYQPRHGLLLDGKGIISDIGESCTLTTRYPHAQVIDYGSKLILPGFIDAHVHFPQLDIIGGQCGQLLEWLQQRTFPAEAKFSNRDHASRAASAFCQETYHQGVVLSGIFSSVHASATHILFDEYKRTGGRAIIGKCSMDRNAPLELLVNAADDSKASLKLIEDWHGFDARLYYAVTPRFAPSCSDELLTAHKELLRHYPDLYVQTHYAENIDEIAWVKRLFPTDKDYLAVYERSGLLTRRTVLAHAIHASEDELARIRRSQVAIAHCPTSNLFLGSGLFPAKKVLEMGIEVGLGTDVGGGTSFSLWKTMDEAYKVSKLRGEPLNSAQLFYMATLGGARALQFGESLGNFAIGKFGDFQVLEPSRSRLMSRLHDEDLSGEEILTSLIYHADDRMLAHLVIAGREILSK